MHQAILRRLPVWQAHEEALVIKRGADKPHSESNFIRPDHFRQPTRVINNRLHCSTQGQAHNTKVPVRDSVRGPTFTVCLRLPAMGHQK